VIRPFSKADIERLLACCDKSKEMGVRSTAILLLLLDTGMRRAELEGLEIEDVDLDAVRHTTDRRLADYCPKKRTGNLEQS